jgi:hypothetical protein
MGSNLHVDRPYTTVIGRDSAHIEASRPPGAPGVVVIRSGEVTLTFSDKGVAFASQAGSYTCDSFARFAEVVAAVDAMGPRLDAVEGRLSGSVEARLSALTAEVARTRVKMDLPPISEGFVDIYVKYTGASHSTVYRRAPTYAGTALSRLISNPSWPSVRRALAEWMTVPEGEASRFNLAPSADSPILTYADLRVRLAEIAFGLE